MTIAVFVLILCSVAFGTTAQIFYKKGVGCLPEITGRTIGHYIYFGLAALETPLIWCGLSSSVAAIALWLIVLAQIPLSVAFSLDSLQYVLILAASSVFLHERIGWMRIFGTGLVIAGIIVVALS